MSSLIAVLLLGTWIYALVDIVFTPTENFKKVGKSKGLWIVLIVLFGIFAAVPYFIAVRSTVK